MKFFFMRIVALLIIFQPIAFAEIETFSASGEYLMSDYDTPEIAEKIALDFAKQSAAEQAGIYLESYSRLIGSKLDSKLEIDEIKTVASNKIEVLKKNISRETQSNGRILLRADIQATVDTSEIDNFLKKAHDERQQAIQRYKNLQAMNAKIKKDIEEFQDKLTVLRDDVRNEELLVEQERINREFLAVKKSEEFDAILNESDDIKFAYDVTLLDEAIKIHPKLFFLYIERGSFSSVLTPNVKDISKAVILEQLYELPVDIPPSSKKEIDESMGKLQVANMLDMATSYSNSGLLAQINGNNDEAQQNFEKALKVYNEAIRRAPNSIDAYILRADFYKDCLGDFDKALADYDTAIKINPKNPESYKARATAHSEMKRFAEAVKDYEAALKIDSKNFRGLDYSKLGDAYKGTRNYSKALDSYTKAIKIDESPAYAYSNRATLYFELGQFDKAIDDCDKGIKAAEADEDEFWTMSLTHLKEKILRGKDISTKYDKSTPKDINSLMERGRAFAREWNCTLAAEYFTKVLALDPIYQDAYFERGKMYLLDQIYDAALDDCNKLIELNPEYDEGLAYNLRGCVYENLGQYEKALADFNKALDLNSNNEIVRDNRKRMLKKLNLDLSTVDALLERAEQFKKNKEYARAIEDYTKVLELEPNNQNAYFRRGGSYLDAKQYMAAVDDYNKLLVLNPNYDRAVHYNRGQAHRNLKNYDAAIADYTKYLEREPNDKEAYFNRGMTYIFAQKYEEALADYNKLLALDPDYDSAAYNNRGWAYENLGKYDEALSDYEKALELDPNNEVAKNNRQSILDKIK